MRLWVRCTLLAVWGMVLITGHPLSNAQQDSTESHRKMVSKVVPNYPTLAHDMRIAGTVKVEAVVAPNGTVKSAAILGGHPVLGQSAVDAVRRCKWEVGPRETKEVVILNFHPE